MHAHSPEFMWLISIILTWNFVFPLDFLSRWNKQFVEEIAHRYFSFKFFRSASTSMTRLREKKKSNQKVQNSNKDTLSWFYLQCNTWYLILVTWYLLPGTCYLMLATWYLIPDSCLLILCLQYLLVDKCYSRLVTKYFLTDTY